MVKCEKRFARKNKYILENIYVEQNNISIHLIEIHLIDLIHLFDVIVNGNDFIFQVQ